MKRTYLTLQEVGYIHITAILLTGGMDGIRDQKSLESAVYRPQSGYYADLFEEAAALLESLVNNHPYFDANKRTGFVAADSFLRANGFRIAISAADAEQFILEHLKHRTFKFEVILQWLRTVSKPL